ncbi:Gfo/Idh/MocA family protein [Zavarzinella formosa]|uniref:Gfo/Idh/MocA family protein n=1 Tax=Zavarzinella formosa TaxID=360055 RepID=UPI0002F37229|nr:Gfo/Idh/MocA family oxidoreductase [Zavarzinella formosa]
MQTRRTFLVSAGATALASSVSHAANDTINVACLGTGGRCRHLMKSLAKVPNVRMAAVCDIWEKALDQAKAIADPKAIVSRKFQDLLDRKDIDAVLIGSPDHWHVPMAVAACAAGKDVYVEKPLTHDLSEGKAIVEAQNTHKRIVQVGTQQRSMPHIIKAKEIIQSGGIGQVFKVHMSWNRNTDRVRRFKDTIDPKSLDWKAFLGTAKAQDYDEYRFRNWRWFWDFGGGIFTDLMVHWIDVAHWILKVDHPEKAVALGNHLVSKDVWETPDTVQTVLTYPGGIQMHFEGTFANAHRGAMITFMGKDATLYLDRGAMIVTPERNKKLEPQELILGKTPTHRGADFYDLPDGELLHLTNWVESMKSRQAPSAPAEGGVSSASAAHLANKALRNGGVATWKE